MTRHTKKSLAAATLGLSILLTGCSGTVLPPTFSAQGVREMETLDGRTRVVFVVNATNPNREPIPLERVEYSVAIDGGWVYEGVRSPESTLPGYSSQLFEIPAVIGADSLRAGRVASYMIDGSVKYHIPGPLAEVLYDADLRVPEAPLHLEGSIDLGQ
ncbi:MAG: LEA type 2 family protein [Phycisphaerales bacterium]|nr:LEA type 2 family protein [Phycisphaerales bacterium]